MKCVNDNHAVLDSDGVIDDMNDTDNDLDSDNYDDNTFTLPL